MPEAQTLAFTMVGVVSVVLVVAMGPTLIRRGAPKRTIGLGVLLSVSLLVAIAGVVELDTVHSVATGRTGSEGTVARRNGRLPDPKRGFSAPGAAAGPTSAVPSFPPGTFSRSGVATFTVRGKESGIVGTVEVQVPPGYLAATDARRRYPVLEAFSGIPGTPNQWIHRMNLGGVIGQEASAGNMGTALIVSPQTQVPQGTDTECVNGSPGKPQVETWLTRDVPAWVKHTFRVRTDRSSWATIGLSMGGWCAAMATLLHPAQYGAAVVLGGYFRPDFDPSYLPYPPSSPLTARYDLVAKAGHVRLPVAMWLQTSLIDHFSHPTSSAFLAVARPPLAVQALVLQHAGHSVRLWRDLLPAALHWLGRSLPGFR